MLALDRIGASDDLQMLSVRNRTTEKSSVVSCRLLRPAFRSQGARKILDEAGARRHAVTARSREPQALPAKDRYPAGRNPSRACLVFVGAPGPSTRGRVGLSIYRSSLTAGILNS